MTGFVSEDVATGGSAICDIYVTNVDSFQNEPSDLDQGRVDSWDNIFEHGDWCSVCSLSATMSDRRGAHCVGLVEGLSRLCHDCNTTKVTLESERE